METTDLLTVKPRKKRTRFPKEAKETLERVFMETKHPNRERIGSLAVQLGYKYETIKMWFDNRRYNEVHRPGIGRTKDKLKEMQLVQKELLQQRARQRQHEQQSTWITESSNTTTSSSSSSRATNETLHERLQKRSARSTSSPRQPIEQRGTSGSVPIACQNNLTVARPPPPLAPVATARPLVEPMRSIDELNRVLDVDDGTRGESKKAYEMHDAFVAWMETVERRLRDYDAGDDVGEAVARFRNEARRLWDGVAYVCEMRFSQGDRKTVSNDYTTGVFSLPVVDVDVDDDEEEKYEDAVAAAMDMEFRYVHESKLEGVNRIASERLVISYFDPTMNESFRKDNSIGVKARGSGESMESTRFAATTEQNRLPLYDPDASSEYYAWGDATHVKRLLKTTLTEPQLLSFLLFCADPNVHGAHWLSVCVQRRFFDAKTPHYY